MAAVCSWSRTTQRHSRSARKKGLSEAGDRAPRSGGDHTPGPFLAPGLRSSKLEPDCTLMLFHEARCSDSRDRLHKLAIRALVPRSHL